MRTSLIAIVTCLLVLPQARADGCKFRTDGRLVPEREQRAFIEWENGIETLHVAALADPTTEGTVWIVPVRASARSIQAEPVERFPSVVYYETLGSRAERQLRDTIALTQLLDSGGFFCLSYMGCGSGGPKGPFKSAIAIEESRVERFGMVVVVVSAQARGELEMYLDAQGVDRAAADLSSLEPYFGKPGNAFVCGWVAKRGKPVTATGLKVVFPTPTIWFPLQPTRAYSHPVQTVVYVRGFVKPAPGCEIPDLKCQSIYGDVKEADLRQAFDREGELRSHSNGTSGRLEPLTRVTLTADPQKWDRDLELVPGTAAAGTVAIAITQWPPWRIQLLPSSALGALLGLFIPWLTIARADRCRSDWLAGALTGAAIVLSIWASLIVFGICRAKRFADRPRQPSRWLVLPALAAVHFGIVLAVCHGLMTWINTAG